MRIVLTQDIEKLGKKGDIKEVADGYARNFLFPKNLAKPATELTIKDLSKGRLQEEKRKSDEISRYQQLAKNLDGKEITFSTALGESGRAFGSVSASDITDELKKGKIEVSKEWVELEEPIKKAGGWDVKIKLPHGIEASIKVVVEAKKEEAKKRGRPKTIKG